MVKVPRASGAVSSACPSALPVTVEPDSRWIPADPDFARYLIRGDLLRRLYLSFVTRHGRRCHQVSARQWFQDARDCGGALTFRRYVPRRFERHVDEFRDRIGR
jgi:hypothetical protein